MFGCIGLTIGIILIINDTSGFTSNTLLIRFPIILSVYIVNRMNKVERMMVKTKEREFFLLEKKRRKQISPAFAWIF